MRIGCRCCLKRLWVRLENLSACLIWFLAQISLGQAFNPGLFRDIGVGRINGAAWTITTEIIFYLIDLLMLVSFGKDFSEYGSITFIAFILFLRIRSFFFNEAIYRDKTLYDIFALTPIVWGWMFGLGILAVKYFEKIKPVLPYFWWFVLPMIPMILFGDGVVWGSTGNSLGIAYLYATCR